MSPTLREVIGPRTAAFDQLLQAVARDAAHRYQPGRRMTDTDSFALLKSLDDAGCRLALLEAFLERQTLRPRLHVRDKTDMTDMTDMTGRTWGTWEILGELLTHLGRTSLDWRTIEARAVLSAISHTPFEPYETIDDYRFSIGIAERLHRAAALDADCEKALEQIRANVRNYPHARRGGSASGISSLSARLTSILAKPEDTFGGDFISDADAYGPRAIAMLRTFADNTSTLAHLTKPTDSALWRAETARRHSSSPMLHEMATALIEALPQTPPTQLAPSSVALIKGAAAVLAEIGDWNDAGVLERAALHTAPDAQGYYAAGAPARACIAALGQLGGPGAEGALARHPRVHARVRAAPVLRVRWPVYRRCIDREA